MLDQQNRLCVSEQWASAYRRLQSDDAQMGINGRSGQGATGTVITESTQNALSR